MNNGRNDRFKKSPNNRLSNQWGIVREQYHVVESLLPGVFQPEKGHQIHHVDGDERNNTPSNLVICENQEYHRFLHIRTEALKSCGNANWRKCTICKQYDSVDKLKTKHNGRGSISYYHKICQAEYDKDRYNYQPKDVLKEAKELIDIINFLEEEKK